MTSMELIGHVNEAGQLELDEPIQLPPGTVRIFIEAFNPEDAADEARWAESFAASQDNLTRMAQAARKAYQEGLTVELDPDELEQDDS
ncbi:MAG: hypothetical protein ACYDBJ_03585 [Aggregatilineales bacterium]